MLAHVQYYFYGLGALLGFVQGAIQSLTRSTYSKLLPETEDHATYFSFFDVTEKEKIEHCFDVSSKAKYARPSKTILSISPREKQVLRLISDGYSSKQIADMLYISNHTAISHRKNLIEKFKVKNTAHLVKRAHELMQI